MENIIECVMFFFSNRETVEDCNIDIISHWIIVEISSSINARHVKILQK